MSAWVMRGQNCVLSHHRFEIEPPDETLPNRLCHNLLPTTPDAYLYPVPCRSGDCFTSAPATRIARYHTIAVPPFCPVNSLKMSRHTQNGILAREFKSCKFWGISGLLIAT